MLRIEFKDPNLSLAIPNAGGGGGWLYKGKPFTGVLVEYKNGILISESEYIEAYKHGRQAEYYDKGQLDLEYYEKFNGFYKSYKSYNKNGTLVAYIEYSDDGVNLEEKHYNDHGELIGHWIKDTKVL